MAHVYAPYDLLAPLLSALALTAIAGAAWRTLLVVNKRAARAAWIDGFRDVYGEFWKDEKLAEVRKWIVSENEYREIEKILRARAPKDKNGVLIQDVPNRLDGPSNDKLELIDRFCSVLTRLDFFSRLHPPEEDINEWRSLYARYWIDTMNKREALRDYVTLFWPRLDLKNLPSTPANPSSPKGLTKIIDWSHRRA